MVALKRVGSVKQLHSARISDGAHKEHDSGLVIAHGETCYLACVMPFVAFDEFGV